MRQLSERARWRSTPCCPRPTWPPPAAFRRERLEAAALRLRDRLQQVRAQEENHRRRLTYDKVKVERDELAAELARFYQPIAAQLADLVGRIEASDRKIERINDRGLPSDAERLFVAELVARDLEGFARPLTDIPRIARQLRLPTFNFFSVRSVHVAATAIAFRSGGRPYYSGSGGADRCPTRGRD